VFSIALFAVDWLAFGWFERHFAVLSAVSALCFVHLPWARELPWASEIAPKSAAAAAVTPIFASSHFYLLYVLFVQKLAA
jgi:hypothetical protein